MQTLPVHSLELGMKVLVDFICDYQPEHAGVDGHVTKIEYGAHGFIAYISVYDSWSYGYVQLAYNGNPHDSGFTVRKADND